MKRPKPSKKAMHQKRLQRLENAQNHAAVTGKNIFFPEAGKAKVRAFLNAKEAIRTNAHPTVRNKRIGCKYEGWMTISLANRPAEWRAQKLEFYGDWAAEKQLNEILPEIHEESNSNRKFEIDCYMTAIDGSEFKAETHKIFNPKNLDDLDAKVKAYISEVVDLNLFDLDKCYAEIRA